MNNKLISQTITAITKFVFLRSKLGKADLIIVAGSGSTSVPKKVAEIYRKGYANKIILTGGFNKKIKRFESEAMRDIVVASGVPLEKIFIEKKSRNTKENAIESLRIVKRNKLRHSIIILVGLAFHTRRLKMTFTEVFPDSEILVTSPKGELVRSDGWWKNEYGRQKVFSELIKIGKYYMKGDLSLH